MQKDVQIVEEIVKNIKSGRNPSLKGRENLCKKSYIRKVLPFLVRFL